MFKMGTLYGVSLGPGDPGLITRRAWKVLNSTAHWAYPVRKKGGDSYALNITNRAGLMLPGDSVALVFPMTYDPAILARYWEEAAQTVLPLLQQGCDVAFLVEGDASTYSTFSHLARTIQAMDTAVMSTIIPGVTSYTACAAVSGIPLVDSDDSLAVVPAGYGVKWLEKLLTDFDTLALLKVKPLLEDIIDLVERSGLAESSYFIEKAGTPEEQLVNDIRSLRGKKVNYLSLIIIHNPNRARGEIIRGCRQRMVIEEGVK